MIARIYITLKEGVLDPQGKTVQKSLHSIGFKDVADVRIGKYIEVTLPNSLNKTEAQKKLKQMCDKMLANTVIENYRFDMMETGS